MTEVPPLSPKSFPKARLVLRALKTVILTLYARGMTTRDIQGAIKDLYHGAEISHSVIANVTDAVIDEVTAWQNRPLDSLERLSTRLPYLRRYFLPEMGPSSSKHVFRFVAIL